MKEHNVFRGFCVTITKLPFMASSDLPMPDMVVWDMDGTLLKSKASRFVTSENESNVRRMLELLDKGYKGARNIKASVAPNLVLLGDKNKARILGLVTQRQDDAIVALESLDSFGVNQIIVSNNSRAAIGGKVMTHFGLKDLIGNSLFREDMHGMKKPDVRIMQAVMESFEVPENANVWVVGDSALDMRFALNADDVLPQVFVPIAMGEQSRASLYLQEHITDSDQSPWAIANSPLEVAVMAAIDPDPPLVIEPFPKYEDEDFNQS